MKKVLLLASVYLVVFISFVAMPLAASPVFADAEGDICNGVSTTGGGAKCGGSGPSLASVVAITINILSVIVGIVAVIMIIVAGFRYVTSGGDSGKTAGAKDTITYAVVGLVVVAFSQAIVKFVLNKAGV